MKKLYPLPNNVGKVRVIKNIRGLTRTFRIVDEIMFLRRQKNPRIICLQKVRFIEERRTEYRFGYYMLGVKPGMRGKWVWGQYCLLIRQNELRKLIKLAKAKGWI